MTGIDGFGFLMSCQEPIYGGKKKPQQVVEGILAKAVSAGYAKRKTVGSLAGFEVPVIKEKVDDFKYLRLLAQRYCMSLFSVAGELIFDNVVSNSSPLISFTVGMGLLSFERRLSLQGQVGEVEIWGRDENQKFIKGSAKKVSVGGSGKTAVEIASKFKQTALREYNEYVRTEKECVNLGPGPAGQPGSELCVRQRHLRGHSGADPRAVYFHQGSGQRYGGQLLPLQGLPPLYKAGLLHRV